jgi:2-polyprenyl-6-methoxyphenol hydroxylase-like FAD-dependent oxidoreductase
MRKSITIVGGGLAGLTLGIGLRRRGVPVTVWEAGHYPRHRVCGEFINGRGLEVLARLGVREQFERAGAVSVTTAAFFAGGGDPHSRKLPAPGLSFSRFLMDDLLAREFRRLDGELRDGARWRENIFGEGVVRASGRRMRPIENDWRWFGLKVHARNVALAADLEMHTAPNGYVGLSGLANGETNVCGLFRRRKGARDAENGFALLRGKPGSRLNERLALAAFDEKSFCSVAGLTLRPQPASSREECCVGDAITMIPPVTGSGMSMAFESAEMAIEPLVAWSRGKTSWRESQRAVADRCDAAFARRLAWARWLQAIVLSPVLQRPLVLLTGRSEWFWRLWFERTR